MNRTLTFTEDADGIVTIADSWTNEMSDARLRPRPHPEVEVRRCSAPSDLAYLGPDLIPDRRFLCLIGPRAMEVLHRAGLLEEEQAP